MMKRIFSISLMLATALFFGGCASIMNGGRKEVSITSNPSGAKVLIKKIDSSEIVFQGSTPAKVPLFPGRGYFSKEIYTVSFQLEGYETSEILLRQKISGWYFGNIVLPGTIIWMLAVDPFTGGMWNITPDMIKLNLKPLPLAP